MSVGPTELVLIVLVVFLLFGSRRLADLGKGIGDGIRGFKRGIAGEPDDKSPVAEAPKEPKQLTGRVETPPSDAAVLNEAPSNDAPIQQAPGVATQPETTAPANVSAPTAGSDTEAKAHELGSSS